MGKYDDKIDLSDVEAERQRKLGAAAAFTIEAGRKLFIRACLAEGIDPARNVSPTLLKLIGGKDAR